MDYRKTYRERRTFLRYDAGHVLAYLNEELVDGAELDDGDNGSAETNLTDETTEAKEAHEATTAYAYTGTMGDGGTLIDATTDDRDALINGVIRTRYTQSQEDALKTHMLLALTDGVTDEETRAKYSDEWTEFCAFRRTVIDTVDLWLAGAN